MNRKIIVAFGVLSLVGAVIAGCSKHDFGVRPDLRSLAAGPAAPPDTNPRPRPTPPPDTSIVPVTFISADSTLAGTTGISRWWLGNDTRRPYTTHWTLIAYGQDWPGYPIQGDARLAPRSSKYLEVPFPVPSSATSGFYTLYMTVTLADGVSTYSTYGYVRVYGNEPPPPPPPPPSAVVFAGADSIPVGGTGNTYWQVTNQSNRLFSMSWTLSGVPDWTGFPRQGSVELQPLEQRTIPVQVVVPDTAAVGPKWVQLTVALPDTSGTASSSGWFNVVP